MKNNFKLFQSLHNGPDVLIIGNVWNVQSAKVFEQLGVKAIATSSYAVAESLGYDDGEEMSFDEYLFIVNRIAASTTLPLSVDLEAGYGSTAEQIASNITRLAEIGVSGINIEDSRIKDKTRTIENAELFADRIKSVCKELNKRNVEIFINLRSDVYLLNLPAAAEEAGKRIKAYESTGAHGLFFPCLTDLSQISVLTQQTQLPVSVMCMPNLPSFDALQNAGIKRISMANFLNKKLYTDMQGLAKTALENRSFGSWFS
jgi:2-methylisocitrate lyase-like PEP mutase family enzyme